MAETFGSLIDYIGSQLAGFVTDPPMYATLANTVQAGGTEMTLELPAQAQPQGLVEIDNELIHVSSYDAQTGVATIPAWGRAQQGTTAAAHVTGAKVTINPRYPRKRIGQVINQVIAGMCPPLFTVQRDSFTTETLRWEYDLPAGARNLLYCEYRPFGDDTYDWRPLNGAHIKRDGDTPTLHIPDGLDSIAAEVRFTVAGNPTPLSADADLFTATGLPESCVDIVSLGAIPRLLTTAELARQQLTSVEASERAVLVPSGSGTAAARFYMQMYETRLLAEVRRLRQEYPLRVKRTI